MKFQNEPKWKLEKSVVWHYHFPRRNRFTQLQSMPMMITTDADVYLAPARFVWPPPEALRTWSCGVVEQVSKREGLLVCGFADMAGGLTCRVQFLDDVDPFAYCSTFPEPPRPPLHTFSEGLPLATQIAAVHRLLRAPHRVSFFSSLSFTPSCAAVLGQGQGRREATCSQILLAVGLGTKGRSIAHATRVECTSASCRT